MEEHILVVSPGRRYRFNWRQVFYRVRPIVMKELAQELAWDYFSQTLVTDYELLKGEERMAYRDPRGTLYLPHGGESIPLGTLEVERFRRPEWRFNKLLFIEKEGFFEALKAKRWPERFDCALLTSKGQPTRAARDIIDLIGNTTELVIVFCLHDADAYGTVICQTLQEETKARPRRNIEIINLGLEPQEAVELAEQGLVEIEDIPRSKNQRPVADYVDAEWAEWLQEHRVELNAFTTPDFLRWLDAKMAAYEGKLIPPAEVMEGRLDDELRETLRRRIEAAILERADVDGMVERAVERRAGRIERAVANIEETIALALEQVADRPWTDPIDRLARRLARKRRPPR
jgi:hypothetical protein